MTARDDAGGLAVSGGAGSTAARFEDLELFAGRLRSLGEEIAAIGVRCGADVLNPALLWTQLAAPASFAAAEGGMIRAGAQVGGQAGRVLALGLGLGAAARAYRLAEEEATRCWEFVRAHASYAAGALTRGLIVRAVGVSALGLPVVLAAGAGVLIYRNGGKEVLQEWLADHPDASEQLGRVFTSNSELVSAGIDALPGFLDGLLGLPGPESPWPGGEPPWPHDTVSLATLVVGLGSRFGVLGETPVEVSEVTGGLPAPARGPGSVSELFRRTHAQSGPRPGQVRVERLLQPDGTSVSIVELPGTQEWSPKPGELPTDLTTNVNGVAGQSAAMMRVAEEALGRLKIPPGEPVLLSGYSQGGIMAAALAADPGFRSRYNVRAVFTVGSPIAHMEIPDDVQVLSVEHDNDLVPNLDGAGNPGRANWTTVSRELELPELSRSEAFHSADEATRRELLADPFYAHRELPYLETLHQAETSGGASFAAWMAANRQFFSGAPSTSRDFAGRRAPAGGRVPAGRGGAQRPSNTPSGGSASGRGAPPAARRRS